MWQSIAFAMITMSTGTRRIRPSIFASPGLRFDVVDGEIGLAQYLAFLDRARFRAAVNAGVVIPHQHPFSTPMGATTRHIHIRPQCNDRRHRELVAHSAEELTRLLNHHRLPRQQQVDSARHGDDRKGFPCAAI